MDVSLRSVVQGDGRFYGCDFFDRQPTPQIGVIGKTECLARLAVIAGQPANVGPPHRDYPRIK
jgi:hypothetical protein